MKFDKAAYVAEMKEMVDKAIQRLIKEKPKFEVYSMSIWTDPDAAVSAVNFDSKRGSDKNMERHNKFIKKYHDQFVAEGDLKTARSFKPRKGRNSNPADFELRDFELLRNTSVPRHWEAQTDRKCWSTLHPLLKRVGDYAFKQMSLLNIHPEFELGVNGRLDWYQFVWSKKKKRKAFNTCAPKKRIKKEVKK